MLLITSGPKSIHFRLQRDISVSVGINDANLSTAVNLLKKQSKQGQIVLVRSESAQRMKKALFMLQLYFESLQKSIVEINFIVVPSVNYWHVHCREAKAVVQGRSSRVNPLQVSLPQMA